MGLKTISAKVKLLAVRKAVLSLAVLALGAQVTLIGEPAYVPLKLFSPVVTTYENVLSNQDLPLLGFVTYASQTNLNRAVLDSDRDTAAILSLGAATINGVERSLPLVAIVRSPSRTGAAKSEHRVMPALDKTQSPITFTRGELDPYFAGVGNASEDLIIGFQTKPIPTSCPS